MTLGIDINNKKFGLFWNVINYRITPTKKENIEISTPYCPLCKINTYVVKNGHRYNFNSHVQKFQCEKCIKYFTIRGKYLKAKFNPLIIERILILFKDGLSTREIKKVLLKENNVMISHNTISKWLRRFNPDIKFQVNGSHRPELRIKISLGVTKYMHQRILNENQEIVYP